MHQYRLIKTLLTVLSLCVTQLAFAAGTDSRSSAWLMSLSRIHFSEHIRGFVDIQPRFTLNDISGGNDGVLDTLLMRAAVGYQLTKNVGLYQGYAYIPTYDHKKVEHRSFQELFIQQQLFTSSSLAHRFRFEQRSIDGVSDTAYRLRYFGRVVHPLHSWHPKLSLAINEEVFINLNDADSSGPQSGFDQNRLFIGFNYRVSPQLAYEIGYQNQLINRQNQLDNISNHILFFGIQTNFSFISQ